MKNFLKIPKIIHQFAPEDKKKWHPIWKPCRRSWLVHHVQEWRFDLWGDRSFDFFIKKHWSDKMHWEILTNFPIQIVKLDIARYIIMYEMGGIYSDMDTFCYKNFYNTLDSDKIYLGPSHSNLELVQNSLLISTGRNLFWREVIAEAFKRIKNFDTRILKDISNDPESPYHSFVRWSAGCGLLSDMYEKLKNIYNIEILDKSKFQVEPWIFNENIITRHMLTGRWGNEANQKIIDSYKQKYPYLSNEEILKLDYKFFRGIDLDTFNWHSISD